MVEFIDVYKSYGDRLVIKALSFRIVPDKINQLIAPQSRGKTTVLKMIYGATKPDDGFVRVFDADISSLSYSKIILLRRYIGIIFEDIKLVDGLTARDNILFIGRYTGKSFSLIDEVVEVLNIGTILDKYPEELSVSEQALIGIARALSYNYPLIVADEPFRFISEDKKNMVLELIKRINRRRDITFLITSQVELDPGFYTITMG